MARNKHEQIQAGKKYRLLGWGPKPASVVCSVKEIRGENVVVAVGNRETEMPVKEFAKFDVVEVE